MLNRVVLMGRITRDLELKQTPAGDLVLSFTVAVERNFKDQNGQRQTDFIICVAWGKTAEHIHRYFAKGRMIAIEGKLRTRTYDDKNKTRHFVTEVFVDSVSFTGEKSESSSQGGYQNNYQQNNSSQQGQSNDEQPPENDSLNIGDFDDFDDVLSNNGLPF